MLSWTWISQEIGRLHGELSGLDAAGSRADALVRRLRAVQVKLVKLSQSVDLNTDAGKRELIEAPVVGLDVETIGEGTGRRVKLTLKLIAQDLTIVMDPADLQKELDAPLDPDTGFALGEAPEYQDVPIRRLSEALLWQASQNVAPDHRDSRV